MCSPGPSLRSGLRLRAPATLTPAKRLKFESYRRHQCLSRGVHQVPHSFPRHPTPTLGAGLLGGDNGLDLIELRALPELATILQEVGGNLRDLPSVVPLHNVQG